MGADPFTAAMDAITEILGILGTNNARKYTDEKVRLLLEIQTEESRGDDADDAKLESLYQELQVIIEAAKDEITTFLAAHH